MEIVRLSFALIAFATLATSALAAPSRRDVFVRFAAPLGGNGERGTPYSSIQEMVDRHDADWGQVFLYPGVYEEDVDIHRGRFWFFPAQQYGVVLQGSITVRRPGIKIRGIEVRSEGSGIILAEGARDCEVQHCRITSVGKGGAGIEIAAKGVANCLIGGNVVELAEGEGEERTGIRIRVDEGVAGNRADHNRIAGCETGVEVASGGAADAAGNLLTMNECVRNVCGISLTAPGVTATENRVHESAEVGVRVQAAATLERNRVWGNRVGLSINADGASARSNVIWDNGVGVHVGGGVALLSFNTVHGDGTAGALITVAEGARLTARFNILSTTGETLRGEGDFQAQRNLYSKQPPHRVAGEGALFGEPMFVAAARGDFHLSPGSPAIGAASAEEADRDADGAGRPRGQNACIGAFEAAGQRETREILVIPGAGDGDGSREKPFGGVQRALDGARPGDTIILRAGEYTETVTITCSGAPGALVTVRSEEAHQAVVRGHGWRLSDCCWVRLEGIQFAEPKGPAISLGPYVRYCEIVGNRVVREAEGGGGGMTVAGPGASYNLFQGNCIELNRGGVGLQIGCQRWNWHVTIRHNDISGCYYGIQSGGGSYPTAPPGYHLVEENELHDNWKDGYHSKTTDNIIRGNRIHHNSASGITTRYGSRNVIVGNRVHDNGSHGMRLHSKSHFVINNLIHGNGGSGIHLASWPGSKDGQFPYNFEPYYEPPHEVWIANNTLYGNADAPVFADNGSQMMLLRNILVGLDPGDPAIRFGPGGIARQVEQNLYWQARPPLLREYEGGAHEIVADPLFVNADRGDFRLSEDSPARQCESLGDALSAILSETPAGIRLERRLGCTLE